MQLVANWLPDIGLAFNIIQNGGDEAVYIGKQIQNKSWIIREVIVFSYQNETLEIIDAWN